MEAFTSFNVFIAVAAVATLRMGASLGYENVFTNATGNATGNATYDTSLDLSSGSGYVDDSGLNTSDSTASGGGAYPTEAKAASGSAYADSSLVRLALDVHLRVAAGVLIFIVAAVAGQRNAVNTSQATSFTGWVIQLVKDPAFSSTVSAAFVTALSLIDMNSTAAPLEWLHSLITAFVFIQIMVTLALPVHFKTVGRVKAFQEARENLDIAYERRLRPDGTTGVHSGGDVYNEATRAVNANLFSDEALVDLDSIDGGPVGLYLRKFLKYAIQDDEWQPICAEHQAAVNVLGLEALEKQEKAVKVFGQHLPNVAIRVMLAYYLPTESVDWSRNLVFLANDAFALAMFLLAWLLRDKSDIELLVAQIEEAAKEAKEEHEEEQDLIAAKLERYKRVFRSKTHWKRANMLLAKARAAVEGRCPAPAPNPANLRMQSALSGNAAKRNSKTGKIMAEADSDQEDDEEGTAGVDAMANSKGGLMDDSLDAQTILEAARLKPLDKCVPTWDVQLNATFEQAFALADKDGNGVLNRAEFRTFVKNVLQLNRVRAVAQEKERIREQIKEERKTLPVVCVKKFDAPLRTDMGVEYENSCCVSGGHHCGLLSCLTCRTFCTVSDAFLFNDMEDSGGNDFSATFNIVASTKDKIKLQKKFEDEHGYDKEPLCPCDPCPGNAKYRELAKLMELEVTEVVKKEKDSNSRIEEDIMQPGGSADLLFDTVALTYRERAFRIDCQHMAESDYDPGDDGFLSELRSSYLNARLNEHEIGSTAHIIEALTQHEPFISRADLVGLCEAMDPGLPPQPDGSNTHHGFSCDECAKGGNNTGDIVGPRYEGADETSKRELLVNVETREVIATRKAAFLYKTGWNKYPGDYIGKVSNLCKEHFEKRDPGNDDTVFQVFAHRGAVGTPVSVLNATDPDQERFNLISRRGSSREGELKLEAAMRASAYAVLDGLSEYLNLDPDSSWWYSYLAGDCKQQAKDLFDNFKSLERTLQGRMVLKEVLATTTTATSTGSTFKAWQHDSREDYAGIVDDVLFETFAHFDLGEIEDYFLEQIDEFVGAILSSRSSVMAHKDMSEYAEYNIDMSEYKTKLGLLGRLLQQRKSQFKNTVAAVAKGVPIPTSASVDELKTVEEYRTMMNGYFTNVASEAFARFNLRLIVHRKSLEVITAVLKAKSNVRMLEYDGDVDGYIRSFLWTDSSPIKQIIDTHAFLVGILQQQQQQQQQPNQERNESLEAVAKDLPQPTRESMKKFETVAECQAVLKAYLDDVAFKASLLLDLEVMEEDIYNAKDSITKNVANAKVSLFGFYKTSHFGEVVQDVEDQIYGFKVMEWLLQERKVSKEVLAAASIPFLTSGSLLKKPEKSLFCIGDSYKSYKRAWSIYMDSLALETFAHFDRADPRATATIPPEPTHRAPPVHTAGLDAEPIVDFESLGLDMLDDDGDFAC